MNELNNQTTRKLCMVIPMLVLGIAHWFPWKKILGHDLHRLEAYAIGTATIVGTAAVAIADSDEGNEHAKLLLLTAISAGVTTVLAWWIDEVLGRKQADG